VHQVCPLCQADRPAPITRFPDGVLVSRCGACGLRYTSERHADPSTLFEQTDGVYLGQKYQEIVAGEQQFYRHQVFEYYLDLIKRHTDGRRQLDVGCGQGFFPALARDQGFSVEAIEPSRGMAAFARDHLGLAVQNCTLESAELAPENYDVITFTDSLEYVPDPLRALQAIRAALRSGGIVMVKVPNGAYFDLRHRVEKRVPLRRSGDASFSPSLRVVHYSRDDLVRLSETSGLSLGYLDSSPPIHSRSSNGKTDDVGSSGLVSQAVRVGMYKASRLQYRLRGRDTLSQALILIGRK
jgi:SAM-dependent methyltransferase